MAAKMPEPEKDQSIGTVIPIIAEIIQLSGLQGDAHSLFHALDGISHTAYETHESTGLILLTAESCNCCSMITELLHPISLNDIRASRKMVETSSCSIPVLCNGQAIFGWGDISAPAMHSRYTIRFLYKGCWTVQRDGLSLVKVENDDPRQSKPDLSEELLMHRLKQVFPGWDVSALAYTTQLIMAVSGQSRGTNILITEEISGEVERLIYQSTLVTPFRPTPEMMQQVTRIDGTLVMDPGGVCYAIGAILDGLASKGGNRARGGRYNSAVMYCENAIHACMIIIFSQDGGFDLLCSARH